LSLAKVTIVKTS